MVQIYYSLQVRGTPCKNGHLTLIYAYLISHLWFGISTTKKSHVEMKSTGSCSTTITFEWKQVITTTYMSVTRGFALSLMLGLRNCRPFGYFDQTVLKTTYSSIAISLSSSLILATCWQLKRPFKIHRQPSLLL